jgi:hypothetical protein
MGWAGLETRALLGEKVSHNMALLHHYKVLTSLDKSCSAPSLKQYITQHMDYITDTSNKIMPTVPIGCVPNVLMILPPAKLSSARFGSTKPPKYVQSRPPTDPSTKIPDPRIVPPDHGEPAGPFPSTLLYENYPAAPYETVEAMENAKSRPSSCSTMPAHL